MRFLVDAQLPARLATLLNKCGHEAIHTSSLPEGNRSTDQQICTIADTQGRIVVTKDVDFRNSHLLTGSPRRLLIVATGNITNDALLKLVGAGLAVITQMRSSLTNAASTKISTSWPMARAKTLIEPIPKPCRVPITEAAVPRSLE